MAGRLAPRTGDGHDSMHKLFTDGVTAWCYCLCNRCWRNDGFAHIIRGTGKERQIVASPRGTCICETCPCRKERHAPGVPTDRHRTVHNGQTPKPKIASQVRGNRPGRPNKLGGYAGG